MNTQELEPEVSEAERYCDPMSVPLPDDPRQHPHPESEEWNDSEWRAEWLAGLTDEELDGMSPLLKGLRLKAYVWANGYSLYGEQADLYTVALRFFNEVVRGSGERFTRDELIKFGAALKNGCGR